MLNNVHEEIFLIKNLSQNSPIVVIGHNITPVSRVTSKMPLTIVEYD